MAEPAIPSTERIGDGVGLTGHRLLHAEHGRLFEGEERVHGPAATGPPVRPSDRQRQPAPHIERHHVQRGGCGDPDESGGAHQAAR